MTDFGFMGVFLPLSFLAAGAAVYWITGWMDDRARREEDRRHHENG